MNFCRLPWIFARNVVTGHVRRRRRSRCRPRTAPCRPRRRPPGTGRWRCARSGRPGRRWRRTGWSATVWPSTTILAPASTSSCDSTAPRRAGQLRISKNSGVVPVTLVDQLRSSATTWAVAWTRGATKRTSGTSARMARRSSQVSVGNDPAPALAPPDVFAPDDTISTLVPIAENACSTRARAPSPIATIAITAATPMMMPSVVSSDRSLLRSSARSATRMTSPGLMTPPRRGRAARRRGLPGSGRRARRSRAARGRRCPPRA